MYKKIYPWNVKKILNVTRRKENNFPTLHLYSNNQGTLCNNK